MRSMIKIESIGKEAADDSEATASNPKKFCASKPLAELFSDDARRDASWRLLARHSFRSTEEEWHACAYSFHVYMNGYVYACMYVYSCTYVSVRARMYTRICDSNL